MVIGITAQFSLFEPSSSLCAHSTLHSRNPQHKPTDKTSWSGFRFWLERRWHRPHHHFQLTDWQMAMMTMTRTTGKTAPTNAIGTVLFPHTSHIYRKLLFSRLAPIVLWIGKGEKLTRKHAEHGRKWNNRWPKNYLFRSIWYQSDVERGFNVRSLYSSTADPVCEQNNA